jgi:hypothetical protein
MTTSDRYPPSPTTRGKRDMGATLEEAVGDRSRFASGSDGQSPNLLGGFRPRVLGEARLLRGGRVAK